MKKRIFTKSIIALILIALLIPCLPVISSADGPEITARTFTDEDKAWYDNDTTASTFTISTVGELAYFMELGKGADPVTFNGKTVRLAADIVWNDGVASDSGFVPSGAQGNVIYSWASYAQNCSSTGWNQFRGTFDGQGHKISGIYITTDSACSGFFGKIRGATIKNVRFENGYHCNSGGTSPLNAGFVVGVYLGNCNFSDIVVNAYQPHTATGFNGNIGGIVGGTNYVTAYTVNFNRCTVSGTIKGTRAVGGIVGSSICPATFNLTDCVNYANISAIAEAAGMIGRNAGTATLTRCVSFGTVTTSTKGTYAANLVSMRYNNNGTAQTLPEDDESCKVVTFNDCLYVPGKIVTANDFAVATINKEVGFKVVVHYTGVAEDGAAYFYDNSKSDWANANAIKALFTNTYAKSTLSIPAASSEIVAVKGVQLKNDPTTFTARFLCTIKLGATPTSDIKTVGFETAVLNDYAMDVADGVKKLDCENVYTSINSNYGLETVTAASLEADYLGTLAIEDIPSTGMFTILVRTYCKNNSGVYQYSGYAVFSFINGAYAGSIVL